MSPQKRTIAQRVNDYLAEPPDAQFRDGKWKFWFIAVAFLSVVNAVLTWLIFRDDSENYSGPIMLSVGALVAWLCVGALHYSDSANRQLARGVSAIDSIALLFVVIHFCGLLYIYGHHRALRADEARYEIAAAKFNVEAKEVQAGNVAIAQAAQAVAQEQTKKARLESDAAFQLRKAAEANRAIPLPRSRRPGSTDASGSGGDNLSTSVIELERPTKPGESSTAFLTKWDWVIRLANCGELLLACLTLILIRNVSAKSNSHAPTLSFDLLSAANRTPAPVGNFTQTKRNTQNHGSFDSEGLKRLREALRDISFRIHGHSFKSAVRGDAVWIYLMRANAGTQEASHSAKARLDILTDARTMPRDKFTERLTRFLVQNGFPIE